MANLHRNGPHAESTKQGISLKARERASNIYVYTFDSTRLVAIFYSVVALAEELEVNPRLVYKVTVPSAKTDTLLNILKVRTQRLEGAQEDFSAWQGLKEEVRKVIQLNNLSNIVIPPLAEFYIALSS